MYPDEMGEVFTLANATAGVDADCIAAKEDEEEEQWKCNFAQEAYAYTTSPIFVLNSALDAWQASCILTAEYLTDPNDTQNGNCSAADGWTLCSYSPMVCSPEQMDVMIQYEVDFMNAVNGSKTYVADGNGAFIYSCHTHCAGQYNADFTGFAVDGVTMQQAISSWWASDFTAPAADHIHEPCLYNEV